MLTGPARVEWRRLAPMLRRIGLFTEADREALTALCRAYGEWVGALEELDKTSAVIRAPSGYPVPNPWLSAARAEKRMFKLMVEFGMTPSSRTRIDATPLPAGTRRDLDDEDLLD
jgi:P27 family predicted phage terminase small subunit